MKDSLFNSNNELTHWTALEHLKNKNDQNVFPMLE